MAKEIPLDDFHPLIQHTGLDSVKDTKDANTVGSSLDHLIGTWTQEEADEMDAALKHFEMVDEAVWQ